MLYASSTPSLALLEVLVWETPESFRERTLLQIDLEDDAEVVSAQHVALLLDPEAGTGEARTRDFGNAWLQEQRSLALVVPSVVMPFENNVVVNPLHPRAVTVRIISSHVITLDQRLLRSLRARDG